MNKVDLEITLMGVFFGVENVQEVGGISGPALVIRYNTYENMHAAHEDLMKLMEKYKEERNG